MGPAALVLVVLAAFLLPSHAFNADAGVRVSLTRNKTVDVTSNTGRAFAVVDGVQSSHWQVRMPLETDSRSPVWSHTPMHGTPSLRAAFLEATGLAPT
jgi:hypothetical protein